MPTATRTFHFVNDTEGWNAAVAGNSRGFWRKQYRKTSTGPATENPLLDMGGCIVISTKNSSDRENNYWEAATTWEALFPDITPGFFVSKVKANYAYLFDARSKGKKHIAEGGVLGHDKPGFTIAFFDTTVVDDLELPNPIQTGPFELRDYDTNVIGTFSGIAQETTRISSDPWKRRPAHTTSFVSADLPDWGKMPGDWVAVSGGLNASDSLIRLRLNSSMPYLGSVTDELNFIRIKWDLIEVTIEYDVAGKRLFGSALTWGPEKSASGALTIVVQNFDNNAGDGTLHEKAFEQGMLIEEKIEDDAGSLRVQPVKLKMFDPDSTFDGTIFYNRLQGLDDSLTVKLTTPAGDEELLRGFIDGTSYDPDAKRRTVEYDVQPALGRIEEIKVADVKAWLGGTFLHARVREATSGSFSAIPWMLLNDAEKHYGIVVGQSIRIPTRDAVHSYQVTGFDQDNIYIAGVWVGDDLQFGDAIVSDNRVIAGDLNWVHLFEIVRAIGYLAGATAHTVSCDRMKFRRHGSSQYFNFYYLMCSFDDFFYDAGADTPKESFFTYRDGDEAAGILRAICESFGLFAQLRYFTAAGAYALYLSHRTPIAETFFIDTTEISNEVTVQGRMEYQPKEDWVNCFSEFNVNYPTDQHLDPLKVPTIAGLKAKPLTLNLSWAWGLTGGDHYRLVIYDLSDAVWDVNRYYWLDNDNATWHVETNFAEMARQLAVQLWSTLKRQTREKFSTVLGGAAGSESADALRLGMWRDLDDGTRDHIIGIRRDVYANETEVTWRKL